MEPSTGKTVEKLFVKELSERLVDVIPIRRSGRASVIPAKAGSRGLIVYREQTPFLSGRQA
jgi:hypothetical protein